MKRIFAFFLALVMLLGSVPVTTPHAHATEVEVPHIHTEDEVTEPTEPVVTDPIPEETQPEETQPDETQPEAEETVSPTQPTGPEETAAPVTEEQSFPPKEHTPGSTACGAAEPVPTYATTDALVTALRQAMVQRQKEISLRLDGTALTSAEATALFKQAREHTGVPNEGDYIRANMVGYSLTVTTGTDDSGDYSILAVTCNFISDAEMEAEVDAAVETLLNSLNLWNASNASTTGSRKMWPMTTSGTTCRTIQSTMPTPPTPP